MSTFDWRTLISGLQGLWGVGVDVTFEEESKKLKY